MPEALTRLLALATVGIALVGAGCVRPGTVDVRASAPWSTSVKGSDIPSAIQGDPPDDDDNALGLRCWRRLESPHFALTTNQTGPRAERILRSLEEYFAALTMTFFPAASSAPERLTVIVMSSEVQTRRYLPAPIVGVFVDPVLYQPLIVLGEDQYAFDDATVRHELVHYAMRLSLKAALPLWYVEGMATYFETLAYDRAAAKLIVGRASLSRVVVLRKQGLLLPVNALVDGGLDEMVHTAPERFYATSWMLVHALIHQFPTVFTAYEQGLLAGRASSEAWRAAGPPTFAGLTDRELKSYFDQARYEAGRRVTWAAPPFAVSSAALGVAQALAVRGLLNLVGARLQPWRKKYHDERALAHAEAARREDPSNLLALQIVLNSQRAVPTDEVRAVVRRNETRWVAWLALVDALASVPGADAERKQALVRAVELAPHDPQVLIRLADESIRALQWQEAMHWFSEAWSVTPDHPQFAIHYLALLSQHKQCGALAGDSLQAAEQTPRTIEQWEKAIRAVEVCVLGAKQPAPHINGRGPS